MEVLGGEDLAKSSNFSVANGGTNEGVKVAKFLATHFRAHSVKFY